MPMTPPPPSSTLFPYTTLFRSYRADARLSTWARGLLDTVPAARFAVAGDLMAELGDKTGAVAPAGARLGRHRSEEHTSELQSRPHLVCRLLLEKKKSTRTCYTP